MFECLRCGYSSKRKLNLINHLKRKYPCNPEVLDIERSYLLEEIEKTVRPKTSKKPSKNTKRTNCNLKASVKEHDLLITENSKFSRIP